MDSDNEAESAEMILMRILDTIKSNEFFILLNLMSDLRICTIVKKIIIVDLLSILIIELYVVNITIIIITRFDSSDWLVSGVEKDLLLIIIVTISSLELGRRLSISQVELHK